MHLNACDLAHMCNVSYHSLQKNHNITLQMQQSTEKKRPLFRGPLRSMRSVNRAVTYATRSAARRSDPTSQLVALAKLQRSGRLPRKT